MNKKVEVPGIFSEVIIYDLVCVTKSLTFCFLFGPGDVQLNTNSNMLHLSNIRFD